jgi:hypothetical protein
MLDRVATEAFLETARRPDTVRQLLSFIGYDAVLEAKAKDQIPDELHGEEAIESLEKFWRQNHHAMAKAKRLGPQSVHTQKRMVTLEDYALRIREHPLVMHAHARSEWTGSWYTIQLCVIAWENLGLDETPGEAEGTLTYSSELINDINNFHQALGVREPFYSDSYTPSVRTVLRPYLDALRMAGQEVILQDPIYIGIYMSISVRLATGFFHSEMQHAITQVLGHGPAGFFAPGRHGFGEDLYASDIIEAIMTLKGVEHVCLNRFKRIGSQYPDRAAAGFIILNGTEVVRCDNDFSEPEYGYYQLTLHGGRKG